MRWAPHLHCTKAGAPQVRGVPPARRVTARGEGPLRPVRAGLDPLVSPPSCPGVCPLPSVCPGALPRGRDRSDPRHRSGRGVRCPAEECVP